MRGILPLIIIASLSVGHSAIAHEVPAGQPNQPAQPAQTLQPTQPQQPSQAVQPTQPVQQPVQALPHAAPLKPIVPNDILSFQGHSLDKLLALTPDNLSRALMRKFKIKGLSNGVKVFQGATDTTVKTFRLREVLAVGDDVGEEDLLQDLGHKHMLENQACIIDIFPSDLNFDANVATWHHYLLCLEPVIVDEDKKPQTTPAGTTPGGAPSSIQSDQKTRVSPFAA